MSQILEEETFKRFGYYPKDLRPSSEKLVVWQCYECLWIKDKKFRKAKKEKLCIQCSNKHNSINTIDKRTPKIKDWFSKNKHPIAGTKRPQKVIDALIKAHKEKIYSIEEKQAISKRTKGKNNPFYGKKHTKDSLIKMSSIQKKIARKGKACNFYGKVYHGKGQWYTNNQDKKFWMRSSWEVKFATYLDKQNIQYEYEHKAYDLIINNQECSYRPDFYLIKENRYIEVKGYWRDDAKIKFESFKEQYPQISITLYMEPELKQLGIL